MQPASSSAVVLPRHTRSVAAWEERRSDPRSTTRGSRLFAEFIWVAFVAAQAADGAFTYMGIRLFGPEIEANPLIAFYVEALGAGLAIVGAKSVAIVSAMVLYIYGRHRTLGVLTIWYLLVAVWPWTLTLWP